LSKDRSVETADAFTVGEFEIVRVAEWSGALGAPGDLLTGFDEDVWRAADWLSPNYWDAEENLVKINLQAFVIRGEDRVIVLDPGVGSLKDRPGLPLFDNVELPFLANLEAKGIRAADVDTVVCTHLHVDHVGGNTVKVAGDWRPTFPSAQYLISKVDMEYWRPDASYVRVNDEINAHVFEDSIAPLQMQGQLVEVDGAYDLGSGIRVTPAPGHTPGHLVVRVESGERAALFAGDVMHSPIQIVETAWNSAFCQHRDQHLREDPGVAERTRREILRWSAERGAVVIPAHFPGPHGVWVGQSGGGYEPVGWLTLT
jgi:glyoxylase-like metal-dependent hydrolase (beta-lactamase superfamily II)